MNFGSLAMLIVLLIISTDLLANCHDRWEGDRHSMIILEATIDDELLEEDDEIVVLTEEGECAGAVILEENRDGEVFPAGLAAYEVEEDLPGFEDGDEMYFGFWDADQEEEYLAHPIIMDGEGRWRRHGFSIINLEAFNRPEIRIELEIIEFGQVQLGQSESIDLSISNAGHDDLIIEDISLEGDFFSVEFDDEIRIEQGDQADITVTFSPEELGEAEGLLNLTSNDPENEEVQISLLGIGVGRILQVHFDSGWNMISINIVPSDEFWQRDDGPDIELMFEQLRIDDDNHQVILVKNETGEFYSPIFAFNNIPYWDFTQGYQVKVAEELEAEWQGVPISTDADVPLSEGWNLIAYFPIYELEANRESDYYVLSSIIDHVIIAKNHIGEFLVPGNIGFSNMSPWRETQGYLVKVDEDVVLNYPEEREEEDEVRAIELHNPETSPINTGSNMSVLLTGQNLTSGGRVSAYSADGEVIGSGVVNTDGMCGLAVWGDDPTTEIVDGLVDGETIELKIQMAGSTEEVQLFPTELAKGTSLTYTTDGFVTLEVTSEVTTPSGYFLYEGFPNPFNSTTTIGYYLSSAGKVQLSVYDMTGRLIESLSDGWVEAGEHKSVLQADELAAGVYMLRLKVCEVRQTRKIVLLK